MRTIQSRWCRDVSQASRISAPNVCGSKGRSVARIRATGKPSQAASSSPTCACGVGSAPANAGARQSPLPLLLAQPFPPFVTPCPHRERQRLLLWAHRATCCTRSLPRSTAACATVALVPHACGVDVLSLVQLARCAVELSAHEPQLVTRRMQRKLAWWTVAPLLFLKRACQNDKHGEHSQAASSPSSSLDGWCSMPCHGGAACADRTGNPAAGATSPFLSRQPPHAVTTRQVQVPERTYTQTHLAERGTRTAHNGALPSTARVCSVIAAHWQVTFPELSAITQARF